MQQAHDILLGSASTLLPNTGFDFQGKGAVTPSEFILAGDSLVATDSRWHWVLEYNGPPLDCLPSDKQLLRAHGIPCISLPKLVTRDVGEWVLCDAVYDNDSKLLDPAKGEHCTNRPTTKLYDDGVPSRPHRRYDVSITYDLYYETPRIWLIGFNTFGLTLSQHEMLQDVPSEYAGKTITLGRHPYTGELNLTVHPCCQMEALYRQNHGKSTYKPENAIIFAFDIWASVLPRFCFIPPKNNNKNASLVERNDTTAANNTAM
ncbi:Autophagocytosis associated protein active-site domain family protein [Babesia bovis T2Bo]|uniref:Autophagocytosis associated protein active-site domain family protein n=1 Tax=Babesia bovis T2Bo TaxID=484906 RepID=UPI001D39DD7A|nr:Autophagocytosis associated protein active-site domain family protein [Babesia bovis T2Bo]KAG6439976.1 Autophagocytosis associated protein active-site domain family protein [Babesia bovis T2Bo]